MDSNIAICKSKTVTLEADMLLYLGRNDNDRVGEADESGYGLTGHRCSKRHV
jgi:hypothetical protein